MGEWTGGWEKRWVGEGKVGEEVGGWEVGEWVER